MHTSMRWSALPHDAERLCTLASPSSSVQKPGVCNKHGKNMVKTMQMLTIACSALFFHKTTTGYLWLANSMCVALTETTTQRRTNTRSYRQPQKMDSMHHK